MRLPKNVITPLGISMYRGVPGLVYASKRRGHNKLSLAVADDGINFIESPDAPVIFTGVNKSEDISKADHFYFSPVINDNFLTYTKGGRLTIAYQEEGDDLWELPIWRTLRTRTPRATSGMFVPEFKHNGQYVLFYSTSAISVALSRDLKTWHTPHDAPLKPRSNHFDDKGLRIVGVDLVRKGILVLYETTNTRKRKHTVSVGAALFDRHNPSKLLWRSTAPLWQVQTTTANSLRTVGAIIEDRNILVYAASRKGGLILVELINPVMVDEVQPHSKLILNRHHKNPIIAPEGGHEWEQAGTFNPATVTHNDHVHMFYRAMSSDGVSRFAYARSENGIDFDRHPEIAYDHGRVCNVALTPPQGLPREHNPDIYASGGGWGGSEDPRAVIIDNHLYISFCVFENWGSMRQAVIDLPLNNLDKKDWAWDPPIYISARGERNKNWMLFPEKINGKFAVLHALTPGVMIDYVDDLKELEDNPIKSNNERGGRNGAWDGFVRGASAPPLKTDHGWLLFYHGMNPEDPEVGYKVGAMILDTEDPTKIIARTSHPILVPNVWYENEHKYGVVYASGAVAKDGELFVYYGGGDRHVCVATAPLDDFLSALIEEKDIHLNSGSTHIEIS